MPHTVFTLVLAILASTCFAQDVQELLRALQAARTDSTTIAAYHDLVNHYRYSRQDSALHFAQRGLDYARNNRYELGRGIMLNALAQVNDRHGHLDLARTQYLEAQSVFSEAGYNKGVAGTANGLGVVAGKTGAYDQATRHFLEALRLYEQIQDHHGVVQTYIKLGVVNDHLGNQGEALTYDLKAEELNSESR
jgi:tetratricopeptide (TPR) repeat protein